MALVPVIAKTIARLLSQRSSPAGGCSGKCSSFEYPESPGCFPWLQCFSTSPVASYPSTPNPRLSPATSHALRATLRVPFHFLLSAEQSCGRLVIHVHAFTHFPRAHISWGPELRGLAGNCQSAVAGALSIVLSPPRPRPTDSSRLEVHHQTTTL